MDKICTQPTRIMEWFGMTGVANEWGRIGPLWPAACVGRPAWPIFDLTHLLYIAAYQSPSSKEIVNHLKISNYVLTNIIESTKAQSSESTNKLQL